MLGYYSPQALLNIFVKTDKVSLVSHLNVGFHEDALNVKSRSLAKSNKYRLSTTYWLNICLVGLVK